MADDDFIGLPPGMVDSGTFKTPPRTERRANEQKPVVFVPVVPGAPLPPIVSDEAPEAGNPEATVDAHSVAAEPVLDTRRELDDDFTPPTLGRHALAGWSLELADGSRATVASALLVGRNPSRLDGWHDAELLSIDDTTQSVSKTHAAFEVDDSGLWVHDLASTNGVWVVVGDSATEVSPGRRVAVPEGATVELGDYHVRATSQ